MTYESKEQGFTDASWPAALKPFGDILERLQQRSGLPPVFQPGGYGTEVRRDHRVVELSAREFALLAYFIRQRGATLSRQRLLKEVWGYDSGVFTRTVDVHVGLLRQKLEEDPKNPRYFVTVRGWGYKFVNNA